MLSSILRTHSHALTLFFSITKWLGIALPATYLNSMIKFLESKLALAFRTRLSTFVYKQYMSNETYVNDGWLVDVMMLDG